MSPVGFQSLQRVLLNGSLVASLNCSVWHPKRALFGQHVRTRLLQEKDETKRAGAKRSRLGVGQFQQGMKEISGRYPSTKRE